MTCPHCSKCIPDKIVLSAAARLNPVTHPETRPQASINEGRHGSSNGVTGNCLVGMVPPKRGWPFSHRQYLCSCFLQRIVAPGTRGTLSKGRSINRRSSQRASGPGRTLLVAGAADKLRIGLPPRILSAQVNLVLLAALPWPG
jgi:hypothetical protein